MSPQRTAYGTSCIQITFLVLQIAVARYTEGLFDGSNSEVGARLDYSRTVRVSQFTCSHIQTSFTQLDSHIKQERVWYTADVVLVCTRTGQVRNK